MFDLPAFLSAHRELKSVELVLTDPSGITRGKWAPASTLAKALGSGVNFPLSLHGLDVWGNEVPSTSLHIESGDLDGFCVAVPHSLTLVPWGGSGRRRIDDEGSAETAQVLLQTRNPDGSPFGGCARTVLCQTVDQLAASGLKAVCAFELEFHLLEDTGNGHAPFAVADNKGIADAQFMYGLDALADKAAVFDDIRRAAQWAGLPVDTLVKEAGPGQFEVNLMHRDDALRAADDVILLKRIIRESARANGLTATFMAKPFIDQPGNGMHVHASLLNDKSHNIFAGDDGELVLRHAAAGLVGTMQEMTLVFINSMNGFRRMAPGSYAPTRANWGENNRSVAVRLPAAEPKARRLEHRVAGADANPYLVAAAILTGMSQGLQNAAEPALPALIGNAYDDATPNRGALLPDNMSSALNIFETSGFAKRALGEQMVEILSAIKRAEIAAFANDISPFERATYL